MGIELLFIQPGITNQNTFVERFNRSFWSKVLDAYLFNSIAEAKEAADVWVTGYNEFRTHEYLCEKSSMEFSPRIFNSRISSFGLST
jgi:putative transposase